MEDMPLWIANSTTDSNHTESSDLIIQPHRFEDVSVTVRFLIAVAAIVGNAMIILAIFLIRYKWKLTYLFILNVCIYDFFYGFIIFMIHFTRNIRVTSDVVLDLCEIKGVIIGFCSVGESLGVLFLAVDRFVFIMKPLRYFDLMTNRVGGAMVAGSAVFSLCFPAGVYSSTNMRVGDLCLPTMLLPPALSMLSFGTIFFISTVTLMIHAVITATAIGQHRKTRIFPNALVTVSETVQQSEDVHPTNTTSEQLGSNHKPAENGLGSTSVTNQGAEGSPTFISLDKVVTQSNGDVIQNIQAQTNNSSGSPCTECNSTERDSRAKPRQRGFKGIAGPNRSEGETRQITDGDSVLLGAPGHRESRMAGQMRITRMLLVAVGLFLISYYPFTAYSIILKFHPSVLNSMLLYWLTNFWFINCCSNPVVYLLFYPTFRKAFKKSHILPL